MIAPAQLHHVAYVVADLDAALPLFVARFGLAEEIREVMPEQGVEAIMLARAVRASSCSRRSIRRARSHDFSASAARGSTTWHSAFPTSTRPSPGSRATASSSSMRPLGVGSAATASPSSTRAQAPAP